MVLLYMVLHGSHQYLYPSHVSIYTSTMDPSWDSIPDILTLNKLMSALMSATETWDLLGPWDLGTN